MHLGVHSNRIDLMKRHENGEKEISLIAFDEAHKLFEWGIFRPAYREMAKMKSYFPLVPSHLHTATMTKSMQDISVKEILENPIILTYTTNRPNIYYRVLSYSPPTLVTHPNGTKTENWKKVASSIIRETK